MPSDFLKRYCEFAARSRLFPSPHSPIIAANVDRACCGFAGLPFTVQVVDEVAYLAVAVERQFFHAQCFQFLELVEDPRLEETYHVLAQIKFSQATARVKQVLIQAGQLVARDIESFKLLRSTELTLVE